MLLDGCAVSSPCVPRGQPGAPAATAGAYPTVGGEPAWARRLNPGRLAGLRRIGIDEFSYRKRHHYLTVVVDHDTRRVVWAGKGRSAETLDAFFDLLGPSGCERIPRL
jgi:transposase